MTHVPTTADSIAELVRLALLGKTVADTNVFAPRDWPATPSKYPMIKIKTPIEHKESLGRNAPQFTTVAVVELIGSLSAEAQTGDAGANALQDALAIFARQMDVAVINNYGLMLKIQQIVSVDTETTIKTEGRLHLGEVSWKGQFEFYQGPEDFAPITTSPFEQLRIYADLVNVFDPSHTYADPPFPSAVVPAPRVSGPDGRSEGVLDVNLPQDF